jgi:3-deoxy-manno-octulosonate cytidylyltransferase (CMP-KDO synthetase)
MSILGIIPARYASSRFPGKPLADIAGQTMLQRVIRQARQAKLLSGLLVATDDERIAEHARAEGVTAVITREDHPSGTDRCFEAYQLAGGKEEYVINIQGDEPFLDPLQIDALAQICQGETQIATQMIVCTSSEVLFDPGEVKIVLNEKQEALYFSRSVIPFLKGKAPEEWHQHHTYYRHVGMYAYRHDILKEICHLAPSSLEQSESLEQLRWLQNGYTIRCATTPFDSHCIDTPEDIEKVLRLMGQSR